jgi:hypothetical protein
MTGISLHAAMASDLSVACQFFSSSCYDFLNIFAKKFSEKIGVLTQNKAKLCKILIITLVFEKTANFFRRK